MEEGPVSEIVATPPVTLVSRWREMEVEVTLVV